MKIILIIPIFLLPFPVRAQEVFTDFTALQAGDSVHVQWTINAGNTCIDMQLQRADMGSEFQTIFEVGGVCGGAFDEVFYYSDDLGQHPSGLYGYRVTGTSGTLVSDTASVYFLNAESNAFLLFPNPCNGQMHIIFDPSLHPPFDIDMHTLSGDRVMQFQTGNHLVTFNCGQLESGLYIFEVHCGNGSHYSGTFIRQ